MLHSHVHRGVESKECVVNHVVRQLRARDEDGEGSHLIVVAPGEEALRRAIEGHVHGLLHPPRRVRGHAVSHEVSLGHELGLRIQDAFVGAADARAVVEEDEAQVLGHDTATKALANVLVLGTLAQLHLQRGRVATFGVCDEYAPQGIPDAATALVRPVDEGTVVNVGEHHLRGDGHLAQMQHEAHLGVLRLHLAPPDGGVHVLGVV
mmetsp:Transcript_16717/g.51442  ORF Transcript_16717/g.51442 Transcript_16717/m.51442 type:complete len:207 (-) Transcript_16717:199-819(-)